MTETLERRALLAIDTAVAQTSLNADTNLMVQSVAAASFQGANAGLVTIAYSDRDSSSGLGNDIFQSDVVGTTVGPAQRVNTTTTGVQMSPDVAVQERIQKVFVWQSQNQDGSGWGIYARAFSTSSPAGSGEILVNQTTAGDQITPRVAIDAAGRFVVTWVNADTGNGEVYARQFAADGTARGNEFLVSGTTGDGYASPDVAMLPTGFFAIAYARTLVSGDNSADVQLATYDANGLAAGPTVAVNVDGAGNQSAPSIAQGAGRYLVAWSDDSGGAATIFFRAIDPAGTAITSPQQASQDSDGARSRPKVAGDANGNFTVGWTRQQSGTFYTTNDFRSYDNAYTPTSNETSIGDGTSARTLFDVVQTGQGTFRDVSTINENVGNGVPISASFENVIALDGTGGNDAAAASSTNANTIRAGVNGQQRDYVRSAFAAVRATLGAGGDSFAGATLTLAVRVDGGPGDDTITGGTAGDALGGGAGDDSIVGNAGDDTIAGDAGADTIRGGAGGDSIGGGDDADQLFGDVGNDYAIGDGGDDSVYGGDGADTLTSGSGKNRLYGGDGNDRVNGSGGRDYLYGEGDADRLYGNGGDDSMDGGGGADKLYGGDGNDYLAGGSSNDRLFGQAGDDTLGGGKNNDYLDGDTGTDTVLGKEPGDTLISIERS